MSGAEAAIAGIGFLCNAMQIVTFGRDILQVYKHVRNEHSPDPRLKAYLENAKACFDDMNSSTLATSQALPPSRDQQQIIEIGKRLEESMTQLQSKFSELHIDDASRRGFRGKIEVGKKSLATLWQGKELESLEVNLKRYESLLHGVVLHRICNQAQAAEISSKDSFKKLDTNLQSVITQLADGRTWMSDLSIESRETRNRITQEHETTRAAINTGFNTTNAALSSFRDSVSLEFQDMAQRDKGKTFEQEHNQLLQSLRFPEMNSRRNHISENYPGTFDWVFKNPIYGSRSCSTSYGESDHESVHQRLENNDFEDLDNDEDLDDMQDSRVSANTTSPSDLNYFPAWLESNAQQFWISGKPASGKSSLMKFLATHPLTLHHLQAQHSNIQILTHYFWKPGQPLQKNIEGMTRSLLHQLLHKKRGLALRLWTEQPSVQDKRDGGDWDMNELRKTLCWAIGFSGNTFCIFLDGLDEAKEFEDLPWGDHQNTQVIYDLLSLNNIKLCASSREENSFCRFFAGQPCLRTHQLNRSDIYHYAENRLEISGLSFEDRSRLLLTVVRKANGVFLWVVLAIKSLNQAIRLGGANEFEERLAQTPSDLHDLLADMWERPGDDAKLSTYSIEASRFFSLALAADDIEMTFRYYGGYPSVGLPLHSMRSVIVLTTALEDKPLASILRDGREIQAKELQARCVRVKDRLRLVCRGLLEVTTLDDDSRKWAGNEALFNYALEGVEFIHRCAFDFITDTQSGRECLALCHWSSTEKVERLLAGHMVKARFLCYKSRQCYLDTVDHKTRLVCDVDAHGLVPALYIAFWFGDNLSCQISMFEELRDWQQRGLFSSHSYWRYPILFKIPSDPREVEFLEIMATISTSEIDVTELVVDQLSIVRLAEAIPVLLRALADALKGSVKSWWLEFVDYLLTRLQSATDEELRDYPLEVQHDVRSAARLLHSWFVMHCSRAHHDWSERGDKITDILCRISNTISLEGDWQFPLILEFGTCESLGFLPLPPRGSGSNFSFGSYALVISNFVTAYRLLGQLLPDLVGCAPYVRPPQDAKERFEILLIRGNPDLSGSGREFFSPPIEHHLDIANCIKESLSEPDLRTVGQRWSVLLQGIDTGLQWIGKDTLGYCIKEVNKRGLELIHPWVNTVRED